MIKKILLLTFLISFGHSMEVPLTPTQLKKVEQKLNEDTIDYTKFNFSNEEKIKYYKLLVFMDDLEENEEANKKFIENNSALINNLSKEFIDLIEKRHPARKAERLSHFSLIDFAKKRPFDIKRIKQLIEKGADVNAKDNKGYTPLYYAMKKNDTDLVELLISKGADKNYIDKNFKTPLYTAMEHYRQKEYKEASKCFIEAFREDPNIKNFGDNNEYIDALIHSYKMDAPYTTQLLSTIELGSKYHFEEVLDWMAKLDFDPTSLLFKKSLREKRNKKLLISKHAYCDKCFKIDILTSKLLDDVNSFVYPYYSKKYWYTMDESIPYLHTASQAYKVFAYTIQGTKTLSQLNNISKRLDNIGASLKNSATK